MNRITCSHCGFINFSISAYCGRCERPLKPTETVGVLPPVREAPVAAPMAAPSVVMLQPSIDVERRAPVSPPRPPIAALDLDVTPVEPRAELAPVREPAPTSTPVALPAKPAPKPVLPTDAVPPPALPVAADLSPAPLPIELPSGTKAPALEFEVLAEPASGLRLWGGRALDLVLALSVGALTALLWGAADAVVFTARGVWLADYVAEWVNLHPRAALAGILAAFVFNLLHELVGGLLAGRTVGRWFAKTMLVGDDGRRARFLPVAVRSLLSVVSSLPLGAGHYWSVVDAQRRTWHDRWAKTMVVVEAHPGR